MILRGIFRSLPDRCKRWSLDRYRSLDPDARVFAVGYLILLPIFLAPVVLSKFLPGLDLPFHLSVADMLLKAGDSDSPYAPFYASRLGLAPYAAHYLWLWTLGHFISLTLAHNLIIGLYVGALPLAMGSLLDAGGRSRIPALLAFPLAYNLTLHYGFISFCLSMPVLAWLFASLMRHLRDDRARPVRIAGCAALAVLLFLCHLQNFLFGVCGALAILVFCWVPWRRRLVGLATLLPAVASLLFWLLANADPGHPRPSFDFAWQSVKGARLADYAGMTLTTELRLRIGWLPEHVLKGFTDMTDVAACKMIMLLIGGYALVGTTGLFFRRAEAGPRSGFGVANLVIFLGASFAYFALPHHLRAFELMTFYPRFSVLLVLFALPLVPAGLRRIPGLFRLLVLAPAVLVCALYGRQIFIHYQAYRAEVNDFVQVMRRTPSGGRVVGLVYDRRSSVMRIESPFVGLPGFYVATRRAAGSMVPLPYCGMRHMPCATPAGGFPLPYPGPWLDQPFTWEGMVDAFDYFFVRSPPAVPLFGTRAGDLQPIAQAGTWIVYGKRAPGARVPRQR